MFERSPVDGDDPETIIHVESNVATVVLPILIFPLVPDGSEITDMDIINPQTMVQVEPLGMVTVTPFDTVMGPADIAFFPGVME